MKDYKNGNRRSFKGIANCMLIVFIAFNLLVGGVREVISVDRTDEVVDAAENSSREELQVVTTFPVIVTEPEDDFVSDSISEDSSEIVFEEVVEEVPVTIPETEDAVGVAALGETEKPKIYINQINRYSTTSERIHAVFTFLLSEGFTPEAASGVIGNIAVESTFDPSIVSSSGYYGLFQWNTSSGGGYWWHDIEAWMTSNGYDWDSFEGQIKAMLYCSNRGYLDDERLNELKQLKNVDQAVELFAVYYEGCTGGGSVTKYYRPGSYYQDLDIRKSEARIAYRMYTEDSDEYDGVKPYSK